jgi:hypothetical protein
MTILVVLLACLSTNSVCALEKGRLVAVPEKIGDKNLKQIRDGAQTAIADTALLEEAFAQAPKDVKRSSPSKTWGLFKN